MSEWHPQVVRLGKLGPHPNADSLSITHVLGGYQVIVRTEDWNEGDLAAYLPVDSLVPAEHASFLTARADGYARVDAVRLRGLVSNGLLLPLPGTAWIEGASVVEWFGLKKYERPMQMTMGGTTLEDGPNVPKYDLEGLRKFDALFEHGEPVVMTEKIHGANARYTHDGETFHVGSRTRWLLATQGGVWGRMAEKYDLETKLAEYPGYAFYGEVFGRGIQDLHYGFNEPELRFFDIYDTVEGRYLDYNELLETLTELELPHVPVIYIGPYSLGDALNHAEGPSMLDLETVREGVVIRPLFERWSIAAQSRCVLKLPGEGYLTRKQAA